MDYEKGYVYKAILKDAPIILLGRDKGEINSY